MKRLLIGVSALALGLVASSGAWANPKNSFSPGGTAIANSAAVAGVTAISESFNVGLDSVSIQTLNGAAVGGSLSVEVIPIFSGNALTGTQSGNAGVTMAQANSGNTSVQQQAVSLAAIGTVTFQ